MKRHLLKSFITSFLGFVIMVADIVYFFGLYDFPSPDFTPKAFELVFAFVIGLGLFLMPQTYIEEQLKEFFKRKNQ